MAHIFIFDGNVGTGKTTSMKYIAEKYNYPTFIFDTWLMTNSPDLDWADSEKVRYALEKFIRESIVLEDTHPCVVLECGLTSDERRNKTIEMIQAHKHQISIVDFVVADKDIAKLRLEKRPPVYGPGIDAGFQDHLNLKDTFDSLMVKHHTIYNSGSLDTLYEQIDALLDRAITPYPVLTPSRQERLAKYHHTDDGYIYSLRAIIKNDQGQILMMYDDRYKTYTVPGGKWEIGDGDMLDSLQREVLEEINCPIVNAQYIGQSKCFREGGAVCHVYYDVIIAGEPQLSEEHMTSFHRFSYVEMDDYFGYDILMDNQRQHIADNILKTWDLFDLVEYRYLITYTHHSDDWKVVLPDVSSIIPDEVYLNIISGNILSLVLEKERNGQGAILLAQIGEGLLTGMQKVYENS